MYHSVQVNILLSSVCNFNINPAFTTSILIRAQCLEEEKGWMEHILVQLKLFIIIIIVLLFLSRHRV